jgi:4-hydroxy-tetrahydrodipicolinate synthase
MQTPFLGCGTALVTPFKKDESLDEEAIRRLVDFQVGDGIDFLVPAGTTGENPTLSDDEIYRLVEIVCDQVDSRVPVMAGCGGNSTKRVIELGRRLQKLPIDSLLSVTPYYNKPTQEGLSRHYKNIADTLEKPVILYNVPGRTGVKLEMETIIRLSEHQNIMGLKDATGDLGEASHIIAHADENFSVLSGEDHLIFPLLALGGHGCISVISNQVPGDIALLCDKIFEGDYESARIMHSAYMTLMEANFMESNPIPIKFALSHMGLIEEVYRLPMTPLSKDLKKIYLELIEPLKLKEHVKRYV